MDFSPVKSRVVKKYVGYICVSKKKFYICVNGNAFIFINQYFYKKTRP